MAKVWNIQNTNTGLWSRAMNTISHISSLLGLSAVGLEELMNAALSGGCMILYGQINTTSPIITANRYLHTLFHIFSACMYIYESEKILYLIHFAFFILYFLLVQVYFESLIGKYVLLYFLSLPSSQESCPKLDPNFQGHLQDIYNIYQDSFRVVFVALGNNQAVFYELFSRVPWLAIPHENQRARDFLESYFSIPYLQDERALLFSPNGTLLRADAVSVICSYGSHAFPFTDRQLKHVCDESDQLRTQLFVQRRNYSLTQLLGKTLRLNNTEKVYMLLGRLEN